MAKGKYEYWRTADGLILLEGWARDGLTDEQIAEKMRISASTYYDYKEIIITTPFIFFIHLEAFTKDGFSVFYLLFTA